MLHGENLWMWSDNKEQRLPRRINTNPATNFYYLSDKELFYMETKEIELNGRSI